MKNDSQKPHNRTNGAFGAFSSYLRIVSSGASTVASSVKSAASAVVERENDAANSQVLWAGFDKLEWEGVTSRQVLLLAYRSGFQVWDVEEADNVCNLVSRHDGAVSFLQVLPKPIISKRIADKFAESRPLLAVCAEPSLSGGGSAPGPIATACNRTISNGDDPFSGCFVPTAVWFYSLGSQSYVHVAKFRSAIYSVRCSSRVVAIAQATQIHCLDAATLEKEYTILTNPIVTGFSAFGGTGYRPLAVGPRWLAYSGSPVALSNSGRVNPQHVATSASYPPASNGSLVAHYAKESSKQLAAGIVTLGDIGYKKLSRYCSELVPDGHNSSQNGNLGWKPNGTTNGLLPEADNVGMVIVRDIVSKSPISQFRAHKSPISSLCFDPSGTLLVTASIQGHNINVFRIMPGQAANSSTSSSSSSYVHLYRLQRGVTNAVIQDISFSNDSHWIMISSSRGTNHLFAISPYGGPVDFVPKPDRWPQSSTYQMLSQQNLYASGPPVTLSVAGRIRSGNSGWRSTVTGAAAAATGKSTFSGAIASTFHNCKVNGLQDDSVSLNPKSHLLVFSCGSMVQYTLRASIGLENDGPGVYGSAPNGDALVVEAMQKWDICRKHIRRGREDNSDIYGENGNLDRNKVFPEEIKAICSDGKAKTIPDEKHPMFISEVELRMHEPQIPLWAKSEIYFQCMTEDGGKTSEECGNGGEIEIEKIPTQVIEARPKHLLPVFDYRRAPKSQPARISDLDNTTNTRLVRQTSGLFENDTLSSRGSASSLDSMAYGTTPTAELDNGIVDATNGWEGLQIPIDTMEGFVYSSDHSPEGKTRLDFVNNRASATVEAQIKLVNNNIEGHIMEKHVQEDDIEFD